jgi:hypothetical protein
MNDKDKAVDTSGDDEAPVAWQHRTMDARFENWSEWREGKANLSASSPILFEERALYARPQSAAVRDYVVPIHKDGNYVFIDGPGDVELDHGGKMRSVVEAATRYVASVNGGPAAFYASDEEWRAYDIEKEQAFDALSAALHSTQEASE